jgi:acyl transferase domain-containing protein/acyl carrier protein
MDHTHAYDYAGTIAIIGMAGRFPGAKNLEAFWHNLQHGVESITFFSDAELLAAGIDPTLLKQPNYVKAGAILEDIEWFDAAFFSMTPRDAAITDPQHRLFLECAWEGLENAGYSSDTYPGSIGVYAGTNLNSYMLFNLATHADFIASGLDFQTLIGNDKDYLSTRVSYKLHLRGPSTTVQTACSTSLVAVHLACQSLLSGECDMALAGGVSVNVPHKVGYMYQEGGVYSPDGHCRAFDARAQGTIFGNGVGIVVLKRFADALADGDCIQALIKGSAINNDGALKVGYTAPSVQGQTAVIAEALAMAGVEADTISYVEAHGTGTTLGDPIELEALTRAFRTSTERRGFCALGTVKSNIGHADVAAGVAGLIKTVLALRHQMIPASLHVEQPNPQINFAHSPFYVNTALAEWQAGTTPRRAGVSAFGIGGTNAHVVLEEAPMTKASGPSRPWQLLILSAKTASALETMTAQLAEHLKQHPALNLADVAYTLQVGRKAFSHRRAIVCHDHDDAITTLETPDSKRVFTASEVPGERPVVFMFPGQGAQYVNMGRELYQVETGFREHVDRCAELLVPHLGRDLREVIYPCQADVEMATHQLQQTCNTQPALFVIEYALAQLWMQWGVRPQAMIGHSIGEYVAACLAGVFSLEDALALVAMRGRLMQSLPEGAMLAIGLPVQEVEGLLDAHLSLAAINEPSRCVVSGPTEAIERLQARLANQTVACHRLRTSHAFHSAMMDAILEPFTEQVRHLCLNPPHIPYLSNLTGTWVMAAEATDPVYWARHLRHTVRFDAGLQEVLQQTERVLLEVGPGQTLSTLAKRHPAVTAESTVCTSIRHPHEQQSDVASMLNTLGKLWLAGTTVDWSGFYAQERRYRLPLPTYPFERQRYWIEPHKQPGRNTQQEAFSKQPDMADWFYVPVWKQSLAPAALRSRALAEQPQCWLVLSDTEGIGHALVKRLEQEGHEVITVMPAEAYSRYGDQVYSVNPHQPEDYSTLIQELRILDKLPHRIVHIWNAGPDPMTRADRAYFDTSQERGFYSLLYLARALGEQEHTEPLYIEVLSSNMQVVIGDEIVCPEKVTMLGPCKVMPQEYPHLVCRSIDIIAPASGSQEEQWLLDQLVAEFATQSAETCVAYRGRHRWIQTFEPMRLPETATPPGCLRPGGVYLITGGLGGIGLVLAEYLAQTVQAKLVLLGRSALPEREAWEQWLATHTVQDAVSRKIRQVQALEALGTEVLVLSADVANHTHMQAVLTQINERFGALHGVIHAAGIAGGGMMQLKTPDQATSVLSPKVQGTLVLDAVLRNVRLDFLVLCSSIYAVTGGFGQVDYCAANAFLDAFAHYYTSTRGTFTVSINWDGWQEVGMAVEAMKSLSVDGVPHVSHDHDSAISHPLIDTCLHETADQAIYSTTMSVAKHWVLDEHRIMGHAVLPGTAYVEMARAAFAHRAQGRTIDIREVFLVAPCLLRDDETKEIRTIINRVGDDFDFVIVSQSNTNQGEEATWQEHARGKIAWSEAEPPPQYDLRALAGQCEEAAREHTAVFNTAGVLAFGPRWQSLQWIKVGTQQALAAIELPERFATDVEAFVLHPALLDVATGFAETSAPDDVYLPFSYERLRIRRPLPAKLYSWARYKPHTVEGIIAFDIVLMDDQGMALVEIDEYTLRRVDQWTAFDQEGIRTQSLAVSPVPASQNFRLETSEPGLLDALTLYATTRQAPGPGEVEIEVYAAGLNFQDVLTALGMFVGPLGSECAGRIVALGEGVEGLQVGDEVIAMGSGCFAAYITTPAAFVVPKPTHLSFAAAAAIPIVFLTAYYALHHVGRLRTGERVLIHAAAGGVGLAALQLAQRAEAEIFATAGSAEKRAFVQSLGVSHVMDSRSLAFADDVLERTQGKGVDLVLNSLAGEFIPKSLATLGTCGRFLEIGKRDIRDNSQIGLQPFQKNLSFFAIDLDLIMAERPDVITSLFREVMQGFTDDTLRPLPHRVFAITEATNAFDYMARAKHIGKIVLSLTDRNVTPKVRRPAKPDQSTGGGRLDAPGARAQFIADHLVNLKDGMLPQEGVEVLRRILAHGRTLPQVVVSTRPLHAVMAHTKAYTPSRIVADLTRLRSSQPIPTPPAGQQSTPVPQSDIAHTLASIWQEVLGLVQVCPHDTFIDLGGDSLLVVEVIAKIKKRLGVYVNPREVVFQTLGQLATMCEERMLRQPTEPVNFTQRLWKTLKHAVSHTTDEPT